MRKSKLIFRNIRYLVIIISALAMGYFGVSSFALATTLDQDLTPPSVTLRGLDLHPSTAAAAQQLLGRLGEAAFEVCGGSSFSLREVKAAIRASSCWRDAMDNAVRRIDSPQLTVAFERAKSHLDRV